MTDNKLPRVLTEEELDQIRVRNKARTQGKWHTCGDGKCQCKQVWASDHPVAQVEHGEWGDSYPALRLVGNAINMKAEPYIDRIPYGEIPEDMATANSIFIAACSEDIPDLLTTINAKDQRIKELEDVLHWYGDEGNHKETTIIGSQLASAVCIDGGQRARKALGEKEAQDTTTGARSVENPMANCARCGTKFNCSYQQLHELKKSGEILCLECYWDDHPQKVPDMFRG